MRLAPGISRVGMIYNPRIPLGPPIFVRLKMVAGPLAVQPINLPIHDLRSAHIRLLQAANSKVFP
jgi:hypothetical protein